METLQEIRPTVRAIQSNQFLNDVIDGLSGVQKHLHSKYFYDEKGDKIFQQIMNCPEYYLTRCEFEIFTKQSGEIAGMLVDELNQFDVVELGAGDATKSSYLLKALVEKEIDFTYYPVDISKNIINFLEKELPGKISSLKIKGLRGEYFEMLKKAQRLSSLPKVVLFLGSNIGNVRLEEAEDFLSILRGHLSVGDLLFIGFDLKKDPKVILDAYNDNAGFTRHFNLNLLGRINRELGADFIIENFEHQPTYNSKTGACESFLVSRFNQTVHIGEQAFHFKAGEKIYMEISQKYSVEQTNELAVAAGFTPIKYFYDSKQWFLDAVWKCS